MTLLEIGKELGISRQAVHQIGKRLGLPPRPSRKGVRVKTEEVEYGNCPSCGKPLKSRRVRDRRMFCDECKGRKVPHSIGEKGYVLRKLTMAPWREIAARLDYRPDDPVRGRKLCIQARHYALKEAKPWPIKKGSDDERQGNCAL